MYLQTPFYLIDENKILKNMEKVKYVREKSGAKCVLALKCFAVPAVFPLMSKYMAGTTSSSLYEARLGREQFGGETQAFSVAYSKDDVAQLKTFCDKIIFNSVSQLKRYYADVKKMRVGLRINPGVSYSHFDLADPARKYSRLGVFDKNEVLSVINKIDGVMFHYNCENDDFGAFCEMLDKISLEYDEILRKIEWVSLGGGLYFTKKGYPLSKFGKKLKEFGKKHNVQVYLEPGEAAITQTCELITTVLDIVKNEKETAIVNASTEAHLLDLLIYSSSAKINEKRGENEYIIAGDSCLAGDIFGTFKLARKLKVGSTVKFADTAGYSMVKKNWFNGVKMPSIAVKRLNGEIEIVREFSYADFIGNLS